MSWPRFKPSTYYDEETTFHIHIKHEVKVQLPLQLQEWGETGSLGIVASNGPAPNEGSVWNIGGLVTIKENTLSTINST
jgi:hypothetical protein